MRHATLLELADARRHPAARRAGRGLAAAAVGRRREGLVPLPAALRRRAVGAAHRGRRTPAGARGGRGRRRATAAGGWRSRSTPAGTPPGSAGSPPSPTWCSTPCGDASARTGLGMAVVIAANRTRHPLDARTLARLAAQYAGRGVVGFGLSNDERRGRTADFAGAFAIAERAGLLLAPHGGELLGPASVRACLDDLHADRLGHGVRVGRGPGAARPGGRSAGSRSRCARCPTSRSASTPTSRSVPLPTAARGRRDGGARRRRPAAVRVAAGRAVRHDAGRPRPHRRPARRAGPDVVPGLAGARRASRSGRHAEIDAWLADGTGTMVP